MVWLPLGKLGIIQNIEHFVTMAFDGTYVLGAVV